MVGKSFGHYKILEKIGEGGMGVVYKARDSRLDRFVAVKVLPAEKVADTDRRHRFEQEAKTASSLNHPNIITIHDISDHEGSMYIVMEYIAGKTLGEIVGEGEIRLRDTMKLSAQIAEALARAHTAGLVHRDLKPSNIMVTDSGLVKVLDFGLAKLTDPYSATDGVTVTLHRTDPQTVMGTPSYMSPEQVRGQEIDHRSDIFNFGLVLYEMLSGTTAFQGESSVEVMNAILKEPPPELPDSVSPALSQIVDACLAKNPENRFESARDLAFALRALATSRPTTGALPKIEAAPEKKKWLFPAITALSMVAAIIFAFLYLTHPVPIDFSTYKYIPFATDTEQEDNGAWSPDGRSIAYLKQIDRRWQVMVRDLDKPTPVQLTDLPDEVRWIFPFWSPDGNQVYFIRGVGDTGDVWSVGAAGGEPKKILASQSKMVKMAAADISPNGKAIIVWDRYEIPESESSDEGTIRVTLWISSPPGAPARKYQPAPFEDTYPLLPVGLRFSPDGRKIGLAHGGDTWIIPWPEKPGARLLKNISSGLFDWLPDSRHMIKAFRGSLWLGDTKTDKITSLTTSSAAVWRPSVSPDGRRILFTKYSRDYDLVEIPLDGSQPRTILATEQREYCPSWSLVDDKMAYITNRHGGSEIWLKSESGGWERPIVTAADFPDVTDFSVSAAVLSPDGSRIAYNSKAGLCVSSTEGGRPMRVLFEEKSELGVPSWSPNGDSLVMLLSRPRPVSSIAIVKVGSPESFRIIGSMPGIATSPVWSPEGRWIAGGSRDGNIYLVSPDGKKTQKLPSPVAADVENYVLVWSEDSSTIYVASSFAEGPRLDAVDIQTGRSQKIADLDLDYIFGGVLNYYTSGSLAPDGKSFITTSRVEKSDLWILEGVPLPGIKK